jgi:hypothetical protein
LNGISCIVDKSENVLFGYFKFGELELNGLYFEKNTNKWFKYDRNNGINKAFEVT